MPVSMGEYWFLYIVLFGNNISDELELSFFYVSGTHNYVPIVIHMVRDVEPDPIPPNVRATFVLVTGRLHGSRCI